MNDDRHALHDGSCLMQRAKLFAYVNNNIDIKRILQDKQFHLQLKSEQKEIIQNLLERKDSMAVLPTGFGKSMCYVPPFCPPSIRRRGTIEMGVVHPFVWPELVSR